MKIKDALIILDGCGHSLVRSSFYRAGVKNGFLKRVPYGNTSRYEMDDEKFYKWLDKATTEVPEGLVKLSEASEMLNVPYTTIKFMCDRGEIRSYNYGAGRGVTYVKPRDVEVAVGIHNQNN